MKRIILLVLLILAGLSAYVVSIAQEAPPVELEGRATPTEEPRLSESNGSAETPKEGTDQLDLVDKLPQAKEVPVSSQVPVQKDKLPLKSFSFWYRIENGQAHTDAWIEQLLAEYNGIFVGPPGKTVYLTFDLGYEAGFTPQILDTLKKEKVKGAFFVTGDYVKRQAELVRRISSEGHLIGNHTANHPDLSNLSREEIAKELKSVDGQLESLGLTRTTFFRPPGGVFNEVVLETAKEYGYRAVLWSFAYRDWLTEAQPERDLAKKTILAGASPGAILLLHGVSRTNSEVLKEVIKELKQKGYTFGSLEDL